MVKGKKEEFNIEDELASRKAQAAKMREKGVFPAPGIVMFTQLDKDKSRTLEKEELAAALAKVAPDADVDAWFKKIDPEGTGKVEEKQSGLQIRALKFQILSSKFPRARTCELHRARSRRYRSQILQVNTRWKALAEIYTMHSFAPFSHLKFFVKNC